MGWESGNARRGDTEQALARRPFGGKGTWEEGTENAKAKEREARVMVRDPPLRLA